MKVAIIGAGMAGLACATELAKHGIAAVIYDKGRGAGGRMATRRAKIDGVTLHFDHGAQYFTARDAGFKAVVKEWEQQGLVAPWPAAGAEAYVGTPAMNAPLKHMAAALDVCWGERALRLTQQGDHWHLEFEGSTESYSHLLLALPAEQAGELLAEVAPTFAEQAAASTSDPCWAVMASFAAPLPIEQDTLRDRKAQISWAARNNAKPGRGVEECWVIHASADHSREILELGKDVVADRLLSAFFRQAGIKPVAPTYLTAHRWRYAQSQAAEGDAALWNADISLGVAGDWLSQPRVEGAWLSGHGVAQRFLNAL
ncbi:NAD(P)-binding protein [Pontixanthobacter aestiaquae]|uniref:NAD(P)-binding protein n=1 Tax=Pontixanthobacter aestiaquae TaxID=1509367 RepID=A0A844ZAD3_9SPHN|nr:NAD(P)-binding protein [Pontixanthobacter aestiaquae]MDN3644976.1 NAD(P)-binding protein [Pontixanthobacter aestiaquae]MXO84023.1 NAD(P)-binding protein [Pontixanthobacter aestiaquae]